MRFLGGFRIRTKLLVIVIVPLAAMLLFAGLWARDREEHVEERLHVANAVRAVAQANRVVVALHDESYTIAAAGVVSRLGFDLDQVLELTGLDDKQAATDAAVASLREAERNTLDPDGVNWAPDGSLVGLSAMRATFLGASADPTAAVTARDALEELADDLDLLIESTAHASGSSDPAAMIALSRMRVQILAESAMFEWASADLAGFESAGGAALAMGPNTYRSSAQRGAVAALPDDLRDRLLQVVERYEGVIDRAWAPAIRPGTPTAVPTALTGNPDGAVVGQGPAAEAARVAFDEYLRELGEIETAAAARADVAAAASVAAAEDELSAAFVLLSVVGVITALLSALVARSITRPLRRVAQQASVYATGALAVEPVRIGGRDELAVAATSIDEGFAVRRQVGDVVTAMARHQADAPDLAAAVPGELGEVLRTAVAGMRDVTAKLLASEALSRAIVENAGEAIWVIDRTGTVRSANDAAGDLLQVPADEQVGEVWTTWMPARLGFGPVDGPPPPTEGSTELAFNRADGTEVPVLLSASRVAVGDEELTVVLAHDISERKRFEEQLLEQATHDDLTGLPNRADLRGQLERACRLAAGGRGFGLLYCDLDRFKQVNDALGHDAGDELLVQVAQRLRSQVGEADTVARLGGDEFVVLVESAGDEAALSRLAERIVRIFGEPFALRSAEVWATVSVGQLWATGVVDPAEVLRRADVAMYRSKALGRNRVEVFDREVQAAVEHRAGVERRLRRALADGDIVGHLQPVVELATGEVVGAELLARWRRHDGTMVSPAEFIPVAEETGLVVDLGRRMLRQACDLLVARRARGARPVRLNVNVSGIHVLAGDLVGDVTGLLAETGAPAELLTIELTETHLMDDADEAVRRLEMIRRLGVGLAIDDFGTGYSSLGYLQQLPVDTVKVDKGFVDGLGVDRGRTAIVEATVSLGATFGLKVVAEGVETEEQADLLRLLGCGYGQGWHFGRPMPADDFELLVDTPRPTPASTRP